MVSLHIIKPQRGDTTYIQQLYCPASLRRKTILFLIQRLHVPSLPLRHIPPLATQIMRLRLGALFLVSLWLAFFGLLLRPEKAAPVILAFMLLALSLSYLAFSKYQYWLSGIGTSPILFAGLLTILVGAIHHYVVIRKHREYIEGRFDFETEQKLSL